MVVQIFEPFSGGHHTKYVALLLPTLVSLRRSEKIDRIVVSTSAEHISSEHYADRLAEFENDVTFEAVAESFRHSPGRAVTESFVKSVARNAPDFVVAPSANKGAFALALRSLFRSPFKSVAVRSVGFVHNGFSESPKTIGDRLRDSIHRFSRKHAPWSELHVVNPLLFDMIERQGAWANVRLRLTPDPVEPCEPIDKRAARQLLGIPIDGRYIGHAGQTDGRKAIPELLAAFRMAAFPPDHRLLIAGTLHEPFRHLIASDYQDLRDDGRLLVIDRYLQPGELHAAFAASDVVTTPFYTRELSESLLAAHMARRPIVASRDGYAGMMLRTFGIGWPCDVGDVTEFATTLRRAVAFADDYRLTQAAERLFAYHDPQNYVNAVLAQLYELLEIAPPKVVTWAQTTLRTSPEPHSSAPAT